MSIYNKDYSKNYSPLEYNNISSLFAIIISVFLSFVYLVAICTIGNDNLIQWGGNNKVYVFYNKEYWRLITSTFIHLNLIHLICNIFFGYQWIKIVEELVGTKQAMIWYFVSGIISGIVSDLCQNVISAGSSGAVYGIVGIYFGISSINVKSIEEFLSNETVKVNMSNILLFTIIGFALNVDNFAHIGGAATGFISGRYFIKLKDYQNIEPGDWWKRQGAVLQSSKSKILNKDTNLIRKYEEIEIDRILDKINKDGIHSITDAERKTLLKKK